MTVSTEISSNEYTGNGVTTDFDYKFRIFKTNQLSVITSDADGDNVVTLRLGTDYTVTGANKSAGGKVVLTKPLANGHKISIARDIPITQETSFRNQSKFFAETHEDAFDYLTMIIQRIWGSLGSLYLKRPNILANWFDAKGYRIANLGKPKRDSDAVDLGTLKDEIGGVNSTILKREKRLLRVDDMDIAALPKASDRAGNVLTFDKDGKPIVVAPATGSAVDVLNILAGNNGYELIGAGDTTVAGLAYVFTKIKNNVIKKEDLKQWVTDGIAKGKTYFSIPTGEYALESSDGTSFIEADELGSEKMFILDFNGSILRYAGADVIESFVKIKGRSAYITARNGRIYCNGKINYGVLTDDIIGISQFNNFEIRNPLLDGFNVSAWLCSFDNAIVFRPGRHGFYIGATALTATSTSCIFKTCWTKAPKGHGYYLGRLTYANFINSAYDGDGAGVDNGHAVIGFHSFVYGLTLTGMGTENYGGRLLKQDGDTFGIRGLTVNNWHLFKVGDQANPMDYLMDLFRITRMTISGISKNDVYAKNTGILRGDTSGDALIISPDGTGSGWVYGDGTIAPSYGFGTIEWSQLPIKRNRGVTKITKTVSTVDEFREYLSYLKTVTIDIGVEIILSNSLLLPSDSAPIVITGLRGGGYVKIMATTANIELGSRAVYKPFSIISNDCTVIFSNLTLVGWNQSGTLFYVDSSKVRAYACKFLAFAQGGIIFEAYNGSDITISSDCTKTGSWLPNGGYEFVTDTTSNISKRTRTNLKWDDL